MSHALKARIEAPIEEPLTSNTFADLESSFPEILATEEARLRSILIMAVTRQGPTSTSEVLSAPLQHLASSAHLLATAVFPCPYGTAISCKSLLFGWKDLCQHRCVPRGSGVATGLPQEDLVLPLDLPCVEEIILHLEAVEAVKSVVQALGLDPATATTTVLDDLEPMIACRGRQVEEGRYGHYTWRSYVRHCLFHLLLRF